LRCFIYMSAMSVNWDTAHPDRILFEFPLENPTYYLAKQEKIIP